MHNLKRLFTAHPASVNETYWGHLKRASSLSYCLLIASTACIIHSIFPWLCVTTASDYIKRLHKDVTKLGH